MNSRSPVASAVSCQTGNKNKFLLWILCCFFPRFFGSPVAFVNFLLFKAIVSYDEPAVVYSRSHSFVGPTTCVNQLSKLSKLTYHERDDPLELVGEVDEDAHENFSESYIEKIIVEKSISQVDSNSEKPIGLEDFEILKLVGQGAFGKVYQVRKTGSSEIFAMKVMRKDKVMEKNHAEYMKAERDILTQIDHPFLFNSDTPSREDLARIYAAEIVSAVAHLHAHGVMHRDLKPENILLDAEGHAMLTDFGLAKQFDEETRSNSMCGTLEYMAPEIILGKGHDKAADWWSVGILLYEMLTGKVSFWPLTLGTKLLQELGDALYSYCSPPLEFSLSEYEERNL
ncbi:UNVERIFIED_CONTAM: Serine/threonine-protein kinase AtPK2/AtPK19 [Sesamum radiatum]|uniref:Serine/threonine-protein kinase AtPK2/AtPK19 n=1 Tax=Sesamum radiatum TaxID=300843 RepID=A0AAW2TH80_SESRA